MTLPDPQSLRNIHEQYVLASIGVRNPQAIEDFFEMDGYTEEKLEIQLKQVQEWYAHKLQEAMAASLQKGLSFEQFFAQSTGLAGYTIEEDGDPEEDLRAGLLLLGLEEIYLETLQQAEEDGAPDDDPALARVAIRHLRAMYRLLQKGYTMDDIEAMRQKATQFFLDYFGGDY